MGGHGAAFRLTLARQMYLGIAGEKGKSLCSHYFTKPLRIKIHLGRILWLVSFYRLQKFKQKTTDINILLKKESSRNHKWIFVLS
jgi:hypothetical protein